MNLIYPLKTATRNTCKFHAFFVFDFDQIEKKMKNIFAKLIWLPSNTMFLWRNNGLVRENNYLRLIGYNVYATDYCTKN